MGNDDKNGVLFSEDGVENLVGRPGMVGDILARCGAGIFHHIRMCHEVVEERLEILRTLDFETASSRQEVLGFAETVVVGTDDDGNAVDRCLGDIVDTHAESATDIRHAGIAVDA